MGKISAAPDVKPKSNRLFLFFMIFFAYAALSVPCESYAQESDKPLDNLASTFHDAEGKWKAHKWEEALSEYDVVANSSSPLASKAHIQMGKYYKYHGLWDMATAHYQEAIGKAQIVRDVEDAETSIGAVHLSKGEYQTAIDIFAYVISNTKDWEQVKYCSYWIKELSRRMAFSSGSCNTCGQNALLEILTLKGVKVSKSEIEHGLKLSKDGASMEDMKQFATKKGLKARGVKLSVEEMKNADLPLIALLGEPNHYVIVTKMEASKIYLINPAISLETCSVPLKEFRKIWKGRALVFPGADEGRKVALLSPDDMKESKGKVCFCCPASNNGTQVPNTPFDPYSCPLGGGQKPGMPSALVNMSNLNFIVQDTDLAYKGRGPGVTIVRTYNADSGMNGSFGRGWTFNYNVSLVENPGGTVDITKETGTIFRYTSTGGGSYSPPKAVYDTLTKNGDGTYSLKLKGSKLIQNFSAAGVLTSMTDRNGNTVTFQYDADNRLSSVTDSVGRVTTINYGTNGKISSISDPLLRTAYYTYDTNDNLSSTTDMAGNTVSFSYDANSYMTGITTSRGRTTIVYGTQLGAISISSIIGPMGYGRFFEHHWPSSGTNIADENGNTTHYEGNGDGYAVTISDALGNRVNYGYDNNGNRNSIQDPNGHTTLLVYDTRGNITSITDPLTHNAQLSYDANDNLTQLIDPALNTYIYEYDSHNNLTNITDPENGPTRKTIIAYNSYGEVTTFTDPKGNSLNYIYDDDGNLQTVTSPINGSDSYTYDAVGHVLTHTDPKNNTTHYSYDGIDRVTQVQYQDLSTKTLTYECCGLNTVADQNGTLIYTHDEGNRLTGFTDAFGKSISYGYDGGRNITSITYPGNKVVYYQYDAANRLIAVIDWLNNVTTYEYDKAGNLMSVNMPDDSTVLYDYDAANRLTSILDLTDEGIITGAFNYTLDALGNRTPISFYQPLMAIPKPQNLSYTYDDENSLLTAGNMTFSYDNNGNLTQKTLGSRLTTFTWNFDNMLTELSSGNRIFDFSYDGLGNRITKIDNSTERRYVVDGGKVLAETDASGTITAYYVYGLGLISKITPDDHAYYYHYDGLGSTIAITDSAGAIVNKYAYDEFGKIMKSEEAVENPFKYVGAFGVMDDGNGLYYMRARFYDPRIGRFVSKDPIGLKGGINKFVYAEDNPVKMLDPLGLYVWSKIETGFAIGLSGAANTAIGTGLFIVAFYEPVAGPMGWLELSHTLGLGVGFTGSGLYGLYYGGKLVVEGLSEEPVDAVTGAARCNR